MTILVTGSSGFIGSSPYKETSKRGLLLLELKTIMTIMKLP